MPNPLEEPATKQDVHDLRSAVARDMQDFRGAVASDIRDLRHELLEVIKALDAKLDRAVTTLLTGFHTQMRAQELVMRRVRADMTNLDTEVQGRLEAMEQRIAAIEERLPPP